MKVISRRELNSKQLIFFPAKCPHCKKGIYINVDAEEIATVVVSKIKRS